MISFGMPTLIELKNLEDSAALCRGLGLQFIELNMSFPQNQLENLDAEKLLRIKEKYGIFYTIHLDEELNPCSLNPGVRRAYVENVLGTVELAKKLGIPTLNMHMLRGIYCTLPAKRVYIYEENEEVYLAYLRQFRDRVTEAIGDSGVKICLENTDGFDLPFLIHGLDLLLESPAFAMTYDIGHDYAIGCADKPVILEREKHLMHMHMHDALGKQVHLALGDGELNLESYLYLAAEHDCRVVLETKTVAALRQSARWVNKWLNMQSSPDELWDVYDENRRPTGKLHRRGELLKDKDYHLVVHVWVRRSDGCFLLTKRAPNKGYPNMWECTGGSALAGDDSLTAALRELREETGLVIPPERGRIVHSYRKDHYFCDVWLFEYEFQPEQIRLLENETCGAMCATADEILQMRREGLLVPYGYIDQFNNIMK